jgi:hypothetical protein
MFAPRRYLFQLTRRGVRSVSSKAAPRGPRGSVQRKQPPARIPRRPENSPAQDSGQASTVEAVSNALYEASENRENNLLAPVHIPEDPNGVIKSNHPAISILANSSIVVQRQIEMMNLLVGFEQANRYVIMDPNGGHIGYLAEQEHGLGSTLARQAFRTHRSFTTHVFDRNQREVLRFHRPFSWINSYIRVYDAVSTDPALSHESTALREVNPAGSAQISSLPISSMRIVGESQQQWAPLRRKYNLFLARDLSSVDDTAQRPELISGNLPLSDSKAVAVSQPEGQPSSFAQFAYVNEPFLSWDFSLMSADNQLIGSVNRNFVGFAREIFTDTGVYALRMDSAGLSAEPSHIISQTGSRGLKTLQPDFPGMTLDQRAVMLATAVSIDFDYFSRHSHSGGGGWLPFMPIWFPEAGAGGAAGAGAGAEGAGAAGAAGSTAVGGAAESGVGAAGQAGRGLGMGEGAITGAGTMAGYEAMQQARQRRQQQEDQAESDDASPQASPNDEWGYDTRQQQDQSYDKNDEIWGNGNDPWSGGSSGGSGGGGGGGEGGDFGDWF